MEDPNTDVATDNTEQGETLNQLAEHAAQGYDRDVTAQSGVSDETQLLTRNYVSAVVSTGHEESLVEENSAYQLETILDSLHIGISYRDEIASVINTQIADIRTGKGSAGTGSAKKNVEPAADPIEMFSGQFTQEVTDLVVSGAGMDFAYRRSYRNQVVNNGPLGSKWDHAYNLHLRQLGNNLIRSSGESREDAYIQHPRFGEAGFNYWVPPDGLNGIIEENGPSFALRLPNGVRYLYQEDGVDNGFHRIQRIQDRFGNYLAFSYLNDQLQSVEINHPARFVVFDYDPAGRIVALRDHTGRQWTYTYDDYGDLVGVTSPATQRYPSGLTTTYEYSSSNHAAPLRHNLLRIIDPAGQLYLENEYGTDRGMLNFNRVVRQRQGNGEYLFEYETVISEFEFDYNASERPAIQVNQVLRNGQPVHFIFNKFGNLLLREEYLWKGLLRRLIKWRYRYNRDGLLIGTITPEGNVTQWYYGRDDYLRVNDLTDDEVSTDGNLTTSARLAFGNLLAVVRRGKRYDLAQMALNRGVWGDFFPDVLAALDPEDIVVKSTYEPDYQQVLSVSDPRFTARADPRYSEAPSYAQHLIRYEYSALPVKLLTRIRHPDCTFPSPLANGGGGLTDIREEYLQYDALGRLERVQDPEGNVAENEYHVGGTEPAKEGYLRRVVRDSNGLALATTYEVNDVGIPVKITNPRGAQTRIVVNELNQIIETILDGPGYRARAFFDRNGLIERQELDHIADLGGPSADGDDVSTYRYDAQNNLLRETRGGRDLTMHHLIKHSYDAADKRVETVLPCGNSVRFLFDERLLPTSTVRGASSVVASTMGIRYDGDGRKTASVDGRGNVTRYEYDTFDRVTATIDALGNVEQYRYDKLGNVVIARFFERRSDGTYAMLTRSELQYDERANRIRKTDYLFVLPIITNDIEHAPDLEFLLNMNQGLVTPVETQIFYDKNRRLFRGVNAKGQETTYEYDGLNRRNLERDALGNYLHTFYDENSNVVRVDRHEIVRDQLTGAPVREDVFSTVHEYDPLDRRIATTDGLGNRTTFTYDSRNNPASVIDPLANVKRYRYDMFNRKIREIREMTESGLGNSQRLPDLITQFTYDDNDRLTSIVDPNGNVTRFAYDELNRRFETTYLDGSRVRLTYDADDNVVNRRDNNGLQVVVRFDALSRLTRVDLDSTGLSPLFPYPVVTEDYEAYSYDALGRALREENNWCVVGSKFDSLGRVFDERIQFTTVGPAPLGSLALQRSFDVLANLTDVVYPSGRAIHYEYDDVNHLTTISNTVQGTNYPGSTVFPDQYDIATFQYRGLRLAKAVYGNQAGYKLSYDSAGRVISTRHQAQANALLDIQQLFDGAGNRRWQLDNRVAGAAPNGEIYRFDSLYRLTRFERTTLGAINPAQFEPPDVPLALAAWTGQQAINAAVGSLAQNPPDYTYRYDAAGNREEERPAGHPSTISVANSLNQIQSVDGVTFLYDRNGNLIADGNRLYRYNYRNQLVHVRQKTTNTELLHLRYDARGRLLAIGEGGQVTLLIHDGFNVIEEYTGANLSRQYVSEIGIDRRCQMASSGEEWWYHRDLLRSTRWLSDSSGQVDPTGRFEYDPFGSVVGLLTHDNPYLYTGKRLFKSIGLYDVRARQYLPVLGRFLQRDPKGSVDGPNLYAYAGNNPVTFTDPFGTEKGTPTDEAWKNNPIIPSEGSAADVQTASNVEGLSYTLPSEEPGTRIAKTPLYHMTADSAAHAVFSSPESWFRNQIDEPPSIASYVPGGRAGWLLPEIITGETISGAPTRYHFRDVAKSLVEDWVKMELLTAGTGALASGAGSLTRLYRLEMAQSAWWGEQMVLRARLESGIAKKNLEETVAGHAFRKHALGSRPGESSFPPLKGAPQAINEKGQQLLGGILTSKTPIVIRYTSGVTEIYDPATGRGVLIRADGTMEGFRDLLKFVVRSDLRP
jgi:RHS repeat-associated protein